MKIEEREIRRVEKVFIADDGTEFSREDACRYYEYKHSVEYQKFWEIIRKEPEGLPVESYDCLVAFRLENSDDITAMNNWLDHIGLFMRFKESDIGTTQVFQVNEVFRSTFDGNAGWDKDFTDMCYFGTPESIKKEFCDYIDTFLF